VDPFGLFCWGSGCHEVPDYSPPFPLFPPMDMVPGTDADVGTDVGASSSEETCCTSYELVYEHNPKHKPYRTTGLRGPIARSPTNGPYALSGSVEIGPRRRLGFDGMNGELVVLPLHRIDEQRCIKYYHGFVIDYLSDLNRRGDITKAARDNGFPLPKK
jgi:hypothetical protein